MTTEPKAEGVEAVDLAARLLGYAKQQEDVRDALSIDADDYVDRQEIADLRAAAALIATPTPSAVEALARAACDAVIALSTDAVEVEFAQGKLRAALAHPEIAALLKETK